MTTTERIQTTAAVANFYLIGITKGEKRIVTISDNVPPWVTDMCRQAHGDMMPDDWRFEFIENALAAIENDDEDFPDIDSLYPYTHDRLAWLSSRLDRYSYCDQAAKELGAATGSIMNAIAQGMYFEMSEVKGLLEAYLSELCKDDPDSE